MQRDGRKRRGKRYSPKRKPTRQERAPKRPIPCREQPNRQKDWREKRSRQQAKKRHCTGTPKTPKRQRRKGKSDGKRPKRRGRETGGASAATERGWLDRRAAGHTGQERAARHGSERNGHGGSGQKSDGKIGGRARLDPQRSDPKRGGGASEGEAPTKASLVGVARFARRAGLPGAIWTKGLVRRGDARAHVGSMLVAQLHLGVHLDGQH